MSGKTGETTTTTRFARRRWHFAIIDRKKSLLEREKRGSSLLPPAYEWRSGNV